MSSLRWGVLAQPQVLTNAALSSLLGTQRCSRTLKVVFAVEGGWCGCTQCYELTLSHGGPCQNEPVAAPIAFCSELDHTQRIPSLKLLISLQLTPYPNGWCHMSACLLNYEQLESMMVHLDPTAPDCRITISNIRHSMDASCDGGVITIRQWRTLLEIVSALQSQWTVRYKGDLSKPVRQSKRNPVR